MTSVVPQPLATALSPCVTALSFPEMTNADESPRDPRLAMLGRLSLSERFMHALTLSVYVRQLAWQGAQQHAGALGETAVVDRFLTQLYGVEVATWFRAVRHGAHD